MPPPTEDLQPTTTPSTDSTADDDAITKQGDVLLDKIVGADEPEEDWYEGEAESNAPDAGHPEKDEAETTSEPSTAPSEEVPADDAVTETEPGDATPDPNETPEAKEAQEKKEAEAQAIQDELAGVQHTEPDGHEAWKERAAEGTRTINRLLAEAREKDEFLASKGRKIITTDTGYGLAATDDAKDVRMTDEDHNILWNSLSETDRELFESSPAAACKLVAEKVVGKLASQNVKATATNDDARLAAWETDEVWANFKNTKLTNGSPKYPDADKDEVQRILRQVAESLQPGMDGLREWASRNRENGHLFLEFCFNTAFRARHAGLARLADAKRTTQNKDQKNKEGARVTGAGSETSVRALERKGNGDRTNSDSILDFVLDSDQDNSPLHPPVLTP